MPNVRVLNNQKLEFFKENRVVPHAMINVDDNGLLVSSHMRVGGNLRVNGSIEATILKGELPAHTHNVADIIGGAGQQNTFSSIALYNSEGLPVPNSPYFALTPNDTITLKASGNISFVMESNGAVTIDDTHYHDPDDISGIDAWIESNPTVVSNTNSRHSHSNKALLDSYTQTEASLADAVNKKHDRTHGLLSADHLVVGLTAGHILMATGSTTVEFKALEASHIPNLDWSKITTGKPTTLSGYGITDAYTKTELETSGMAAIHWDNITDVPLLKPSFNDLTNKPTTLSGYGITDAYTKLECDGLFAPFDHTHEGMPGGVPAETFSIGDIKFVPYGTPGPGWLECNGTAISRTEFSELFEVIGTTFGEGDGETTFNLPDLRGEFIRGWDHGKGTDPDRQLGSWQADAFQGHWHEIPGRGDSFLGSGGVYYTDIVLEHVSEAKNIITDGSHGNPRIASETRPRNIAFMFIIKAKHIAGSDPAVEGSNADTLDGLHASAFALATGSNSQQFSVAAATSNDHAVNLGQFENSLVENGYQRLPNGLILQWGSTTVSGFITFPVTYPNICLNVTVTTKTNQGFPVVNSISSSGFSLGLNGGQSYWFSIGY